MVWVERSFSSNCPGQGYLLVQVAPRPVQPGLEHFQEWGSHRFSGQLCQGLTMLTAKNFFPISNLNLPLFHLKSLPLVLSLHVLVLATYRTLIFSLVDKWNLLSLVQNFNVHIKHDIWSRFPDLYCFVFNDVSFISINMLPFTFVVYLVYLRSWKTNSVWPLQDTGAANDLPAVFFGALGRSFDLSWFYTSPKREPNTPLKVYSERHKLLHIKIQTVSPLAKK